MTSSCPRRWTRWTGDTDREGTTIELLLKRADVQGVRIYQCPLETGHDSRGACIVAWQAGRAPPARRAALLVAKLHKIQDRLGKGRLKDKDALDVLRLLRGTATEDVSSRMKRMLDDARSASTSKDALGLLRDLFGSREAEGAKMAVRATEGLANPAEVALSCEVLAQDLLRLVG